MPSVLTFVWDRFVDTVQRYVLRLLLVLLSPILKVKVKHTELHVGIN